MLQLQGDLFKQRRSNALAQVLSSGAFFRRFLQALSSGAFFRRCEQ
jgi:hypothetical protein